MTKPHGKSINGKLTLTGTFGYAYQRLMFHFPALVHAASQTGPFSQSSLYTSMYPSKSTIIYCDVLSVTLTPSDPFYFSSSNALVVCTFQQSL